MKRSSGGKIVKTFGKWVGVYKVETFEIIHPSSTNKLFTNKKMLTYAYA